MNCQEFATIQTALVEDCLEADERMRAEAHVAVCDRCSRAFATELAVKESVRRAVDPAPAALAREVRTTIRTAQRRSGSPRHTERRRRTAAGALVTGIAATLAVALLVLVPAQAESPVDAAIHDYEQQWPATTPTTLPPQWPVQSSAFTSLGLALRAAKSTRLAGYPCQAARYKGAGGEVAVYVWTDTPAAAVRRTSGDDHVLSVRRGNKSIVLVGDISWTALDTLARHLP